MIGATVKKIDWKNLSYYDFIGFVAVTAILLFVLYFGGLWYATYDYRIQMRDQMVEMYRQLPNPIPPLKTIMEYIKDGWFIVLPVQGNLTEI